MKLGITPWSLQNADAQELSKQAQEAETLGYHSLWLPENHFQFDALPAPLLLLSAVAAATSKIKLATTSVLITLRNPILLAEQIAVLDQISGGRTIIGLGRGFAPDMLRAFGVEPAEKRKIFAANLTIMRRAWAGEDVSAGASKRPLILNPLPAQKPHPPLWVAAFGPKALQQAGSLGLPYLASPIEALANLVENFRIHNDANLEAGYPDMKTRPLMRTICLAESSSQVSRIKNQLETFARHNSRVGEMADIDQWAIVGDRFAVADTLQVYRERLDPSHLVVTRLGLQELGESEIRRTLEELPELLPAVA